ncbi:MAG: class I SAM-dependent methyltransferase [Actinomycetota bacterium]|nr:class I SAM-dependent methyltransferase [Actinomycetota bacterium]
MEQFDEVASSYGQLVENSISFAGQDHDFYVRVKAQLIVRLAARHLKDLAGTRVLDVGCGAGDVAKHLIAQFGTVLGADVSHAMLHQAARATLPLPLLQFDGFSLPFPSACFDVVYAVNVFHHVAPLERERLLLELKRVCSPAGIIIIAEHNPFNPLARLAVARCPFDDGVVLVRWSSIRKMCSQIGLCPLSIDYTLIFPFDQQLFRRVEERLAHLALGAQYLAVLRQNS